MSFGSASESLKVEGAVDVAVVTDPSAVILLSFFVIEMRIGTGAEKWMVWSCEVEDIWYFRMLKDKALVVMDNRKFRKDVVGLMMCG